mmetsp:Transcript_21910/g.48429  ORF Transcript_21910/g.48429 Transcript_21910/m.48429 type:complete len:218 (-) Transcript_21910:217-870(-)
MALPLLIQLSFAGHAAGAAWGEVAWLGGGGGATPPMALALETATASARRLTGGSGPLLAWLGPVPEPAAGSSNVVGSLAASATAAAARECCSAFTWPGSSFPESAALSCPEAAGALDPRSELSSAAPAGVGATFPLANSTTKYVREWPSVGSPALVFKGMNTAEPSGTSVSASFPIRTVAEPGTLRPVPLVDRSWITSCGPAPLTASPLGRTSRSSA